MNPVPSIQDFSDEQLSELYAWPKSRTLRCNLVLNSDNEIEGTDGTSLSLTNNEDRRLLRIIRAHADVVISGALSIRAEGWFLPPRGRLCVLSLSGDLPWETCPDRSRVFVYQSVESLIHGLRQHETRILCEGGLVTAELLAQHYGFDEIALSFSQSASVSALPKVFVQDNEFELDIQMRDIEHNMAFGLWRRAV
jgi:riboflavin biosynthesis pyrimidine reductase